MSELLPVRPAVQKSSLVVCREAMTILVVDDDALVRTAMRALLSHEGFSVLTCEDGPTAVSLYAQRRKIDVLLTDFQMPAMTGLELAEELTRRSLRLQVVLMSGADRDQLPLREIEGHHWTFLAKPVDPRRLLPILDGFCDRLREEGLRSGA